MRMERPLPKGIIKPLARLLWLPAIWLGIGWASLPHLYLRIDNGLHSFGDGNTLAAYGISAACIATGIFLLIYGRSGQMPDEIRMEMLTDSEIACPFCGARIPRDAELCVSCKHTIPR